MNTPIVLLAEDELIMGSLIKEALEARNFKVNLVADGYKAYSSFMSETPHICVLDVMMPQKDGFTLAKEIRAQNPHIPIIFLTAKSTIEDLAEGFLSGANDYLKKPFSLEELIIRMNALLGREGISFKPENEEKHYTIGLYSFNFENFTLTFKGEQPKTLSYKEAQLLKLLLDHRDTILDRKYALEKVWGNDSYFNTRSMDVFITKLRRFLQNDQSLKIVNIRGRGFKLIES